jgi:hypothetical protein
MLTVGLGCLDQDDLKYQLFLLSAWQDSDEYCWSERSVHAESGGKYISLSLSNPVTIFPKGVVNKILKLNIRIQPPKNWEGISLHYSFLSSLLFRVKSFKLM